MLTNDNATAPIGAVLDHPTATAEQVAKVVAGISAIGHARRALENVGWRATIAGNRITINDEVVAHLIAATTSRSGRVSATWTVYAIAGIPPVWVVGAEPQR